MNRFDTAPADGGISMSAQEDEAIARAQEIEREAYLIDLHNLLSQRAKAAMLRIGQNEPGGLVKRLILDELRWALSEGVRRSESGQHAEWILELAG